MANYDEQLAELKVGLADLADMQKALFMEIGELAIPDLRGKAKYSEQVEKLDDIKAKIEELNERETTLLAEKAAYEKAERERLAKVTCFKCGKVNPDDAKFCEGCGGKLGELPREYCKKCGTINHPNLKFCGECGNKLDD